MKSRSFAALCAVLIALSAAAAALCSCSDHYDPTKVSSATRETEPQTTAYVTAAKTEKETEKPVVTEAATEKPVTTAPETEKPVETEAETEKPLDVKTPEDADIYLQKLLTDASIDCTQYDIENNDGEYSSYSAFKIKEAFRPVYSTNSNVFLLAGDTVRIAGDTDFRIGMKIDDFEAKGWTFNYKETESKTLAPYSEGTGTFVKKPCEIEADVYNNGEGTIDYKDGQIVRIGFKQYEADYKNRTYKKTASATAFVLDNKITDESTLNDVLRAFGAPESISYFIDPDYRKLSTVKVSYEDRGAGLGDSDWCTEYIDFIFSCDGSTLVEFSIMG